MKSVLHFGMVLALAVSAVAANQKHAPEAARPSRGGTPNAMPKGGPKAPGKVPAPGKMNLPSPGPVERLLAMPPEQRERVLEKLPQSQQNNLRKRFEQFDQRSPEERARLIEQWHKIANLTPEKREILKRQMEAFNALPDDRARAVRRALNQLGRMEPEAREARLNSEGFKSEFSPAEQQMISDIAANYPFPGR